MKTAKWAEPMTVTYEDFSGRKFEATMELVVFPMQRLQQQERTAKSKT